MREKHPAIDADVSRDARIWRYFDLARFVALLSHRALWFSRADLLGDPLEGSVTKKREKERRAFLESPPQGRTRQELEDVFKHNSAIFAQNARCGYVNCWHLGDHESMAMWKGYADGPFGVAVRSSFGALDDSLPLELPGAVLGTIYLAKVTYVDYGSEDEQVPQEYNAYGPLTSKSVSYRHESELRALFLDLSNHDAPAQAPGYYIPAELNILIHEIRVSPLAPAWYDDVVRDLCAKYSCNATLQKSTVFSAPIY